MPFSCGGQSCPVIPNDVCPSRRLGGMRTAFVTLAVRFLLTLLTYHLSATADYRGQLVDMHPNWTQLDDCGPPPVRNSSIDSLMPRNNPHAFLEEDVCYTLFTGRPTLLRSRLFHPTSQQLNSNVYDFLSHLLPPAN